MQSSQEQRSREKEIPRQADNQVPMEEGSKQQQGTEQGAPEMQTNENEADLDPDCTKGLKSKVWKHYKRQKIDDKWKAICKYCNRKLGGDTRNGTKHLHSHFASCRQRKTKDIRQTVLESKKDKEGKMAIKPFMFDEEVSRRELALMIIVHEYPLSIVEHEYFRRFVGSIQPRFKNIGRITIKRDIMKIYEEERENVMNSLEKNESRFAFTTDMWTSSNQKKGYMAVTAHYIDDSWQLQSRIIRFIHVPCPHTANTLCEVLSNCLMDWNLDQKLSALTLDNCSTNDSMVSSLLDKLPSNNLWLDGKLMHIRCSAHILNLIVRDGLDIISGAIEKIRESVVFWGITPKRNEKFDETTRQLKIHCTKKLVLDCKTRWNSTYLMLKVAIGYKDVFKRLNLRDSSYRCLPSDEEWEAAEQICQRLEVFNAITEIFSGTRYPTSNIFFPKICEIKVEIQKMVKCTNSSIQQMALKMGEKFDKYWAQIHVIMGVATILDPRYKLKFLEYFFPMFYGDERAKIEVSKIRNFLADLIVDYSSKIKTMGSSGCNSHADPMTNHSQSLPFGDIGDCMNIFDLFVASTESETVSVHSELDHYLEEKLVPRCNGFDILSWWKLAFKYPTLQLVAKDILAIPISTVASESAFSTSGRVIGSHRSRLNADTIEALMCTQNWKLADKKGSLVACSKNYTFMDEDEEFQD